jgi:uncharacterized phage-associated protein
MSPLIAAAPPKKDLAGLQSLILCLSEKAPNIGITKLEKLMYLCDFEAYSELGKSITGDTYKNFQLGPVPKHFVLAFEELVKQGKLKSETIPLGNGKTFNKITPNEKCDEKAFSADEWRIIERVLRDHGNKNATELVKLTHDEDIWKLSKRNEEIPYFLADYRNYKKPSKQEIDALLEDRDYLESLRRKLG